MDDFIIEDLELDTWTINHVHGDRWQIVSHSKNGRLRIAEANHPSKLLVTLWSQAFSDGTTLPSLEKNGIEYELRWGVNQRKRFSDRNEAYQASYMLKHVPNFQFIILENNNELIKVILPNIDLFDSAMMSAAK